MNTIFKSLISISALLLLAGVSLQAAEITWTGQGADEYVSTKENWSGNTPSFNKNSFGLMHEAQDGNTYIIPEGASAIATGFDITNTQIVINGNFISRREPYGGFSFNGFWMRGGNTITFGENAAVTFQTSNGATDAVQLTMCSANNVINKHDSGKWDFANMFISTYDCSGGNNNHFNQYAGTVTATQINLGTKSGFDDSQISTYNLYGGNVEAGDTFLNTYVQGSTTHYGRGEINIYGGNYTTQNLGGGTSVDGTINYRSDINVHVIPDSYGTFNVTQGNTYTGKINVLLDSAVGIFPSEMKDASFVSLAELSGNESITINTPLFVLNGTAVTLDTSKNLVSGLYHVNDSITFDATNAGYLEIAPSADPYQIEMTISGLESQSDADAFSQWLNETSGYEARMTSPTSLVLSVFPASLTEQLLLFDFSGYTPTDVMATGLFSSEVPEPTAWLLFLSGVLALLGAGIKKRASFQAN